ncbi:MAG: hypothetical protein WBQ40_17870 [Candidatus Sulfotelmatobacter sp.]
MSDQANDKTNTAMNDKGNAGVTPKANGKRNGKNDKTAQDKPTFDWVTERSSCSLPKVFAELRQQVEEDVKTRNGLRPNNAPYEFSLTVDTSEFTVHLKAKELEHSVTFGLGEHEITVRNNDKDGASFQVTLTFNDQGECMLIVNEQKREFWQIRRMALEDLMFRQE